MLDFFSRSRSEKNIDNQLSLLGLIDQQNLSISLKITCNNSKYFPSHEFWIIFGCGEQQVKTRMQKLSKNFILLPSERHPFSRQKSATDKAK